MLANYFELEATDKILQKKTPAVDWSDEAYKRLASYGVPLTGYIDNSIRNKPVKRGVVAQAIAYLQGQNKDLTTAVEFLINNEISTGQDNTKTSVLDRFGVKKELTRGQAAAFLFRLDKEGVVYLANSEKLYETSKATSLNFLVVDAVAKIDISLKPHTVMKEPDTTVPTVKVPPTSFKKRADLLVGNFSANTLKIIKEKGYSVQSETSPKTYVQINVAPYRYVFVWSNELDEFYLRYLPEKGLVQHALISSIIKDFGYTTVSIKQLEAFDKLSLNGKLEWQELTEELYIIEGYGQIVITTSERWK